MSKGYVSAAMACRYSSPPFQVTVNHRKEMRDDRGKTSMAVSTHIADREENLVLLWKTHRAQELWDTLRPGERQLETHIGAC